MKVIEIKIYSFDELDDDAKERAREWWRSGLDYPWFSESIDSIRAFVEHFGATIGDWEIGNGGGRDHVKTDITQDHFRGRKLKDFRPDYMPTGFCIDCNLWGTFFNEWKKTSDPMYAFQQAIEDALNAISSDIEYQYSNEAVDESLIFNEYEFNSDGSIFTAKEMEIA